ncbi:uncharacterized protein LOC108907942 isoform X2 [Anoplophora glabripennis]|nr:uncharacterized protein LOC108907942 isoform X2 [Anoplophora glabripennis]
MKYLNPTIIDFDIVEEKGNYGHWKYSTKYSEKLSHWPYLPNHAIAHFDIQGDSKTHVYYINSTHRTCLFMGIYCLNASSEFKFTNSNSSNGAVCEEFVQYQCPSLLSEFCKREVVFQRKSIMNNLRKKFAERKH